MNDEAKSISPASANTDDRKYMTIEQARAHCGNGLPKPDDERDLATVYADMVSAHGEMKRRAECFDDLLAACKLYRATYDDTDHHPSIIEEAACMDAMSVAIAKAERGA